MSKFVIATLAAVSILALSAPAIAGYYDAWGYYHCVNLWSNGYYLGCY